MNTFETTILAALLIALPLTTSQSSGGALQFGDLPLPITLRMHTCSDCNCPAIWTQTYSDGTIPSGEKIYIGGDDPNIVLAISGDRNLNSHEYVNLLAKPDSGSDDPCRETVDDISKTSVSKDVGDLGLGRCWGLDRAAACLEFDF